MKYSKTIFDILEKNQLTFSLAESVTGGMVASYIVGCEGASKIFKGGVVCYNNEIKEKILNVRKFTLQKYGAISAQTAREMALGVAKMFNTPISIAVTGIAGNEIENKPCGLNYFCILIGDFFYDYCQKLTTGDRNNKRIEITSKIINEFARVLLKIDK